MPRIALLFVCASGLLAPALRAQATADSTTAVFHSGEWGIGLIQGSGLAEAGVLRFGTPARAWVLDGSASLDRQVVAGAGAFGTDETAQTVNTRALLGPRWYHAVSAHLVRFAGFGISAGYDRSETVGGANHNMDWSAGAYGELGLQYMFTRHLGVGWRGIVAGTRTEEHSTYASGPGLSTTTQTTFYRLSLQPVQVVGTIYF